MSDQVVVSRGKLVAVADAIRGKTETTDTLTLDEMLPAIESIKGGVDYLAQRLTAEIVEYSNAEITDVKAYGFYACGSLTKVSIPSLKTVGDSSFRNCKELSFVYAPLLEIVDRNGFYGCNKLTIVDYSLVRVVYAHGFRECIGLRTVNLPIATAIDYAAFLGCSELVTVNIPNSQDVNTYSFAECSKLTNLSLPKAKKISEYAFSKCSSLKSLIISAETKCTLSGSNAFMDTPIANGTGFIYVPKALIENYKVDTNWTVFASQFRAIEDYPEITGG